MPDDSIRPLTFADLTEGERFRIAPDGPTVFTKANEEGAIRTFARGAQRVTWINPKMYVIRDCHN